MKKHGAKKKAGAKKKSAAKKKAAAQKKRGGEEEVSVKEGDAALSDGLKSLTAGLSYQS